MLCLIPSRWSNLTPNGGVVVSKSEIQCSDRGLFHGRGGLEFSFQS